MIICGIDPGYAITGCGILQHKGNRFELIDQTAICTDKDWRFPKRLNHLYQ